MRSAIIELVTALLFSILATEIFAQTGNGILDVWLKARESADAPNDQKITLYQKSKALVIGMDHYSAPWPQLSNGIRDAEEVAKALTAQGFEVTLKKDLKSDELDRTLKNFFVFEGDDVDTRLLLWFAGHGYTRKEEGYIVPVDAPSPKADAEFRDKAISLRRFAEYMREANSRHVLAIFDSCFAGTVFNTARSMPPPAITLATTEAVREFISSGEADQVVSDDGTFRKLFLDVLAGKEPDADANHDGYVTGTELGLFLQQKMTNLTYNRQTPRYGKLNAYGYDRGDFVFQVGNLVEPSTTAASATQSTSEAERAWAATQGTTSPVVLEDFIKRYGDSFYGTLARARLEELRKAHTYAPDQVHNPNEASSPSTVSTVSNWFSGSWSPPTSAPPANLPKQGAVVTTPAAAPSAPSSSSGSCGGAVLVSVSSRSAQPLSAGEECALKPKELFKECDRCPEMVVVPAGSFLMGSLDGEKDRGKDAAPQHEVTIARSFAIGRFEVTRDEFEAFVAASGYKVGDRCYTFEGGVPRERSSRSFQNPGFAQTGNHPVVCVSWTDAKAYVAWLSRTVGKPYRLPSESEWEYAARAGSDSQYGFENEVCKYANGADQSAKLAELPSDYTYMSCTDGYAYTAPVGSFEANGWGLFDFLGNVWEATEDCYIDNDSETPQDGSPLRLAQCHSSPVRGGSWFSDAQSLRPTVRARATHEERHDDLGFRVVRTLVQ
jgi:formylglycine-generating enzyme required for sulfatase activity